MKKEYRKGSFMVRFNEDGYISHWELLTGELDREGEAPPWDVFGDNDYVAPSIHQIWLYDDDILGLLEFLKDEPARIAEKRRLWAEKEKADKEAKERKLLAELKEKYE